MLVSLSFKEFALISVCQSFVSDFRESPKVFPLKLFSGVIYIANKFFEKINRNPSQTPAVGTPKKVSMQEQSQH